MKSKTVKVYMCGIAWNWEVGEAYGGNTVYPSVEALKEAHDFEHCGVVECEIKLKKWIEPYNWNTVKDKSPKDD